MHIPICLKIFFYCLNFSLSKAKATSCTATTVSPCQDVKR